MMDRQIDEIVQDAERPDRLDEADLAYHGHVFDELRQIPALEARIAAIRGAAMSWTAHLSGKYRLSDPDQIREDGTILRRGEG